MVHMARSYVIVGFICDYQAREQAQMRRIDHRISVTTAAAAANGA